MKNSVPMIPSENMGELLLFQTDGQGPQLEVRLYNESVWLSLNQLADLLQVDKSGISRHLKNIFSSGELQRDSVVAVFATTAADGKTYQVEYFNLDAIISVGYRVNSLRGTQFRIWATERLKEYIVKGFTMDDSRLKEAGNNRYFEELLARIRDIRSSEKIFWRKILDIYATSVDYNPQAPESVLFFKQVQNKMHWAAHGHTAAELIYARVDATKPNMGITNYPGNTLLLRDVEIAKNYLTEEELNILNRIVTAYLEVAEIQALNHIPMTMRDWMERLHQFLTMTGREVLAHAGQISHEAAMHKARVEYDKFCTARAQLPTAVEQHFVEAEQRVQRNIPNRDTSKS
ncbi:virulence RhuM family protein [Bilophila wadsworthia]|uniref:virulence RhuM family protein n=1 Tax=Bilophila wadsworthia TaxID=35833 RepID=UPI002673C32D|nr:virulence RhuM family protein [Bilophila wadsworthia]